MAEWNGVATRCDVHILQPVTICSTDRRAIRYPCHPGLELAWVVLLKHGPYGSGFVVLQRATCVLWPLAHADPHQAHRAQS